MTKNQANKTRTQTMIDFSDWIIFYCTCKHVGLRLDSAFPQSTAVLSSLGSTPAFEEPTCPWPLRADLWRGSPNRGFLINPGAVVSSRQSVRGESSTRRFSEPKVRQYPFLAKSLGTHRAISFSLNFSYRRRHWALCQPLHSLPPLDLWVTGLISSIAYGQTQFVLHNSDGRFRHPRPRETSQWWSWPSMFGSTDPLSLIPDYNSRFVASSTWNLPSYGPKPTNQHWSSSRSLENLSGISAPKPIYQYSLYHF
jgi:hypothetical protein